MDRVVITGCGVVSSIGVGVTEFAEGLRAGRGGARPITLFDRTGFDHAIGCEVSGFQPHHWIRRVPVARLGRAARFAVSAARMAVEDAGLDPGTLAQAPGLVAIGSADGESYELDQLVAAEIAGPGQPSEESVADRIDANLLSSAIATELELSTVETMTVSTACSAGNHAIGYGVDALRAGEVDYVICGGADAMCRKIFAGFYRLGTISPDLCRPFDRGRQGILIGEGAGVLVMESLTAARSRGARVYAEVLGYGANCDAYHPVAPEQGSVAECIRLALADAGVRPDQVDLISAHGTGTRSNDVVEVAAIRAVYGDRPPRTVSMKSMLGHTMGASSALATVGCALAIRNRFIPPTINHVETDPDCPIDCVPNTSVAADLRVVQNNGLAFGGNNASVVLGRLDE